MSSSPSKDIQIGTVTSLAFGGKGVLKKEGEKTTFIEDVLPGEEIEYEIIKEKKNYAFGSLHRLLSPSPSRIKPKCLHFGTCGGCQLQHLKLKDQLVLKQTWVKELLERLGRLNLSVQPTIQCLPGWGYRKSVTWQFKKDSFYYISRELKPLKIKECPLFIKTKEASEDLKQILKSHHIKQAKIKVILDQEGLIIFAIETPHASYQNPGVEFKAELSSSAGYLIHHRGRVQYQWGRLNYSETILGLNFSWHALSFTQNHIQGMHQLYEQVRQLLLKIPKGKLTDLYCGIGVTSLIAAKAGFEVQGYEINPSAIQMARKNQSKNQSQLKGSVDFKTQNLEQIISLQETEAVICNPPRTGLSRLILEEIKKNQVKDLIYISCDPATLARDLKDLTESGYETKVIQPIDCFAQTTHIEVIVWLQLNSS